ncbi:MAG TPA: HEAT repeat domain-containing protein [Gemmataceae bacterium]|nr:HEAT repeat domain-containing protein [Gemmataceae bacterium]
MAYLDDTLEPAQTKLIGQKVAESPAAQELIARIKEVVRRRRLTTPPATGPAAKVDANTIAEYIDSVLSAEQLAEVEEICLASDVHLAEIAACHQILTVILSEPILVPPTARRRMYGLNRGREAIPYRKVTAEPAADHAVATPAGEGKDAADETLLLGLPLYRRHGPWFRRLAPILGVFLLAAGLVAAIAFSLHGILPPSDQGPANKPGDGRYAQNNGAPKVAAPTDTDSHPEQPVKHTKPPEKHTKPPEKHTKPPEKHTKPPDASDEQPVNNDGSAANPDKPPKAVYRTIGNYTWGNTLPRSVLLQRKTAKDRWQHVRGPRSPIKSDYTLVSLPGYRSEIELQSKVGLILWGNLLPDGRSASVLESEAVLNYNPKVDLDITLNHGRIVITNHKRDEARVTLRFQQEVWQVTLPENGCEVVAELWSLFPAGMDYKASVDPQGDGPDVALALIVTHGQAQLKVNYATQRLEEPSGPAAFRWDNAAGADRSPQMMEKLPGWLTRTQLDSRVAKALEKLSSQLNKGEDIEVVLPQAVRDDNGLVRVYGVFALGAISDLPDLLDALGDENNVDVRFNAIITLRNWIALRKGNPEKLYAELRDKYKSSANVIIELLYTYGKEQLRNPNTWESLVAYLDSPKLAIRELANWQLWQLLPEVQANIRFDANGDSDQREAAILRWQKIIPPGQLPQLQGPAGPRDKGKPPGPGPRDNRRPPPPEE